MSHAAALSATSCNAGEISVRRRYRRSGAAALTASALLWATLAPPAAAHDYPWDIPSPYVAYAIAALIGVQTVMILALFVDNRRQRRASLEAQHQRSQLTHAARMALIGEITASITHEVSQPMGAILSNADTVEILLGRPDPPLDEIREIVADIRRDDLRAHEIIKRLRPLLKKREFHSEPINLNDVAASVLGLIQPVARRHNVTVRTALDARLPPIHGDSVHLQQVLLNLVLNAMDAMTSAETDARVLCVSTSQYDRRSAAVTVVDTGHGIAAEHKPKIFNSFFSTKRDGLGLGLSIARTIVQAHGGSIWVEENFSGGASFRFTVPLAAH
jgi:signal transduction histidine kinase